MENYRDRLSDYLDGALNDADRAAFERALHADPDGPATLEGVRRVVAQARTLDDCPPATASAIWAGIAARIGTAPRRRRWWSTQRIALTVPQLLAAGVALVLITGGTVWVGRGGPQIDMGGVGTDPSVEIVLTGATTPYDAAVADLQRALAADRRYLHPETVRILEANLVVIDRAIAEAQRALRDDPESQYLRDHLARTVRHKLSALQQVMSPAGAL